MTLDDIINAKITNAFRSARMTSANPTHINYFIDDKGFGAMGGNTENMEDAVRAAVMEIMQEFDGTGTGKGAGGEMQVGSEAQFAKLARQGVSTARNPQGAAMGAAMSALQYLPHAALVALAIAMIPIIFEELTRAGGQMDLRWKRIMADEFNAFLDRQEQRNTQIGNRQVIIQGRAGFINLNGGADSNTLLLARKGWKGANDVANELDYTDHAKGLW